MNYLDHMTENEAAVLAAVDVVDQRYGTVKAWPAAAWRKCFGIDLSELFPGKGAA